MVSWTFFVQPKIATPSLCQGKRLIFYKSFIPDNPSAQNYPHTATVTVSDRSDVTPREEGERITRRRPSVDAAILVLYVLVDFFKWAAIFC